MRLHPKLPSRPLSAPSSGEIVNTFCYTNSPLEFLVFAFVSINWGEMNHLWTPCPARSASEFQRWGTPSHRQNPVLRLPPAPARGLPLSALPPPPVLLSPGVLVGASFSEDRAVPGNPLIASTSLSMSSVCGCRPAAGNHKARRKLCLYFGADFCQECTEHFIK